MDRTSSSDKRRIVVPEPLLGEVVVVVAAAAAAALETVVSELDGDDVVLLVPKDFRYCRGGVDRRCIGVDGRSTPSPPPPPPPPPPRANWSGKERDMVDDHISKDKIFFFSSLRERPI